MKRLTAVLDEQFTRSAHLASAIREMLKGFANG